MSSPIAKLSVGKSGYGAAHASYITRLSALDPHGRDGAIGVDRRTDPRSLFDKYFKGNDDPNAGAAREEPLNQRTLDYGTGDDLQNADPIWRWNAPSFLTGNASGVRIDLQSEPPRRDGLTPTIEPEEAMPVKDKI